MNILHFSKYYAKGGASRAALDSVIGQRLLGANATLCVGRSFGAPNDWVHAPNMLGDKLAFARFAMERLPALLSGLDRFDTRSVGFSGINGPALARSVQADLCVLHNIDGLLSLRSLAHFTQPLIFRVHDMWAMCGSEHYTATPHPYQQGGDAKGPDWLSTWTFRRKQRLIKSLPSVTICSPSQWLASEFRQSALFQGCRIVVVPNGVDIDVFQPIDRRAARIRLGLDPDIPIILFGSTGGTQDPRKGFDLLLDALTKLKGSLTISSELLLVAFGGGGVPDMGFQALDMGPIADREKLALLYSAANVMVVPSRMENLSLTVLEAMACGTPVIAFEIGGMPDMIEPMVTGWLAKPFDTKELSNQIAYAVEDQENDLARRKSCREAVVCRFSRDAEARQMLALFEYIIDQSR